MKRSPGHDTGPHTQMLKTYYGNTIYAIKRYIKIMYFMFFKDSKLEYRTMNTFCSILLFVNICIAVGDPIIKTGRVGVQFIGLTPPNVYTYLKKRLGPTSSQDPISIWIRCDLCLCSMTWRDGGCCLSCRYWPSLFKLSFHNLNSFMFSLFLYVLYA